MTLHEAMIEVLNDHGGGWMDRDELAREIARRDLFRRPSDGAPPPSDQLRLRARKYSHLFECSDTRCTQIRLRKDGGKQPAAPQTARRQPNDPPPPHAPDSDSWYEELRECYRPARLRILLIGESPPDPGAGERRFFYSPTLKMDNLYRGVAEAVYGERSDVNLMDKPAVLERLMEDGFWLIDAVQEPVNKLSSAARARAIKAAVPDLVDRCRELAPEKGVIICHGKVYAATASALREAGVLVLDDQPLPFPLGNWRAKFVAGFRNALDRAAAMNPAAG